MTTILGTALSNVVAATLLALVVFGVRSRIRRPALLHGLWFIVLLKLVTPPLFRIPLPEFVKGPKVEEESLRPPLPESPAREFVSPAILPTPVERAPVDVDLPLPEKPARISPAPGARFRLSLPGKEAWIGLWLAGTLAWVILIAVRIRRFRKILRFAQPAPDWVQEETRLLASKMGLTRIAPVGLLPGTFSPMLVALGGPARIFLPEAIVASLSRDGIRSLLAHELAHFKRRDHWIRVVELVVTSLYWWLPLVWWIRRELRKAEEECCDAWVVWLLPEKETEYAEALVRTVGLLSRSPAAVAPVASGIGHFIELKRRISMVMQGTTPRMLSGRARGAVLGLALLLPLIPAWSQDKPGSRPPTPPPSAERAPQNAPEASASRQELERQLKELELKAAELRDLLRTGADPSLRHAKAIQLRHAELDVQILREELKWATPPPAEFGSAKVPEAAPPAAGTRPPRSPPLPVPTVPRGAAESADEHYRLAEYHLQHGDLEKAGLEQEEALKVDPHHLPALTLGHELGLLRKSREAEKAYAALALKALDPLQTALVQKTPTGPLSATDPETGRTVNAARDGHTVECITKEGKTAWQYTVGGLPEEVLQRISISAGKVRALQGSPGSRESREWILDLLTGQLEGSRSAPPAPPRPDQEVSRSSVGKIALVDTALGRVAIDLREQDGVKTGMHYDVGRQGKKLGTILIIEVQAWGAWGKPEGDLKVELLRKGDVVEVAAEKPSMNRTPFQTPPPLTVPSKGAPAMPAPLVQDVPLSQFGQKFEGQDLVDVLKARIEIQMAKVREAEVGSKGALRRLERIRDLSKNGLATGVELLDSQSEADLAQSRVDVKRAELKEVEVMLSQAQAALRNTGPKKQ